MTQAESGNVKTDAPTFTQGPWRVDQRTTTISVRANEFSVANVQQNGSAGKQGQSAANARLIAAAPDLYAALNRWVRILRASGFPAYDAEAALAKVRGEA
jgi:hypothetical protein